MTNADTDRAVSDTTTEATAVEVLATVDGRPVCCAQGPVMVSSFHPELSDDTRLHELFLDVASLLAAGDPAALFLIVGDGERVWIHDVDLNQVTARKQAQTLKTDYSVDAPSLDTAARLLSI